MKINNKIKNYKMKFNKIWKYQFNNLIYLKLMSNKILIIPHKVIKMMMNIIYKVILNNKIQRMNHKEKVIGL